MTLIIVSGDNSAAVVLNSPTSKSKLLAPVVKIQNTTCLTVKGRRTLMKNAASDDCSSITLSVGQYNNEKSLTVWQVHYINGYGTFTVNTTLKPGSLGLAIVVTGSSCPDFVELSDIGTSKMCNATGIQMLYLNLYVIQKFIASSLQTL